MTDLATTIADNLVPRRLAINVVRWLFLHEGDPIALRPVVEETHEVIRTCENVRENPMVGWELLRAAINWPSNRSNIASVARVALVVGIDV